MLQNIITAPFLFRCGTNLYMLYPPLSVFPSVPSDIYLQTSKYHNFSYIYAKSCFQEGFFLASFLKMLIFPPTTELKRSKNRPKNLDSCISESTLSIFFRDFIAWWGLLGRQKWHKFPQNFWIGTNRKFWLNFAPKFYKLISGNLL